MRFLKPDFVIIPRICLLHNTPHLETFANVHILVAWFPPFLVFREHCVCLKDCILRLPIIISSIKVTFWQPTVRAQNVRSLNNKSNFQKMAGKMLPHYHGVVLLHAGVVLHDGDKAYFRFHNSSRPLNDPRISIDVVSIVGKNGLQNCQGKKNFFLLFTGT